MADETDKAPDGRPYKEAADSRTNGKVGNYTTIDESTGDDAGNYTFANLDELQTIVQQWRGEGFSMDDDRNRFQMADREAVISAQDVMSQGYFEAVRSVLGQFIQHNGAMLEYTADYVDKLVTSATTMANGEQVNAERLKELAAWFRPA